MVDEIRQDLGFDASKALDTLKALDKGMASFEGRLGQSVKAMDAFNQRGGKTVAMLKRLNSEGNKASRTLEKVAALSGQATVAKGPSVGPSPNVDQYIKQMESMYTISEKATTAQKRAFQSAITSASEYAAKNKISIGQVIAQSNNLGGSFTGTANTLANKLQKVDSSLNAVSKSTKTLTVDFHTMARIVTTQFIVRALSTIRNEFSQSIESAIAFQRKVAEIGTISNGGLGNTDQIGEQVRSLSDLFGVDIGDTGGALYQTISNQIKAGKSTRFLGEAAYFAKGGVTSLENSVNLLSGTLNAYGKDTSETADIASKFFKTIELGRITAAELAKVYGRTAPIAEKLGVSMEELDASYATVTINGIKASEAGTQILGVMNALIKPSKEMKKALKTIGFESGESAIKTLGFQDTLKAIIGTTDGSTTAIGQLIPRVRGLNAGLILTGKGAEQYADNLAKIKATTADLNKQKGLEVMGTDAERVTREWNKLSNAFTTELGPALLKTNRQLFELVGGVDTIIIAGRSLVPVVEAGAIALGAWGAKALYANLAGKSLAGTLKSFPSLMMAAGAAWSAGVAIGDWLSESSAALKKLEADNKKASETLRKMENERLRVAREADNERVKAARQANMENVQNYNRAVDKIKASNDRMVQSTLQSMDSVIAKRKEMIAALVKAANESESAIKASQDRVAGLQRKALENKLDKSVSGFDDRRKASAMSQQGLDMASKAATMMAKATDPQSIKEAADAFSQAMSRVEKARSLASGSGNSGLIAQTVKAYESVIKKQEQAEKKLQQSQLVLEARSKRRRDTERQALANLKLQRKTMKDNLSLFDKKGNRYSPDEITQRQSRLAGALKGLPIEFDIAKSVDNLQTQLQDASKDFKIKLTFDASELEKQLGKTLNTPREIFSNLEQVNQTGQATRLSDSESLQAKDKIAELRGEILQINKDADALQQSIFRIPLSPETKQSLNSFQTLLMAVSQESNVTSAQFQKLREHLQALKEGTTGFDNWGFTSHAIEFSKALGKLKEIQNLQSKIKPDTAPFANLNLILGQADAHTSNMAANMERMVNASTRISIPTANTPSNMQYHASGGLARGTDTIPAMLSPGEFVVNARSSRQFYSQLTAINSGVQPVYRESGGSVTNIGDVSINVSETKSPKQTARDVMSAFRREMRRGSGRL